MSWVWPEADATHSEAMWAYLWLSGAVVGWAYSGVDQCVADLSSR